MFLAAMGAMKLLFYAKETLAVLDGNILVL
jgi:hypothetical protein